MTIDSGTLDIVYTYNTASATILPCIVSIHAKLCMRHFGQADMWGWCVGPLPPPLSHCLPPSPPFLPSLPLSPTSLSPSSPPTYTSLLLGMWQAEETFSNQSERGLLLACLCCLCCRLCVPYLCHFIFGKTWKRPASFSLRIT